jgi:hypothetical protein
MSSSLRRATVIMILLGVILVPGLLQAKTPARDWARVNRPASESGFFSMVWSLLTNFREIGAGIDPSGSPFAKNGGMLDPNGVTAPPPSNSSSAGTTGTEGDNGGMLDPNG